MYIGDLHIHSRFSRATSKDGNPQQLDLWARKKGIQIIGTGDFTHPAWREELKEMLEPAEDGMYCLKPEYRIDSGAASSDRRTRFVVSGEISSIYKKNGKVRKVHSLLLLPGLEAAELLSKKLETIGNIHSDGRPILGLDCRDLLEIMLDTCPEGIYIPAHIWTPHFSMFGAFSGFDTVEECFGDMAPYVHALETGLSSDPPMNWRLSALDGYQLVSNSDAHSPAKLGREANLFQMELSYAGLKKAVETGEGLEGTIEFFPEEGKYHYDGHRKCHICLAPSQTEGYKGRCPVCGGKLTIGVEHRVEQLADREEGYVKPDAKPFESLVPLPEVIASSTGRSAAGSGVQEQYEKMVRELGTEFEILRQIPVEDIRKEAGWMISEGIRRLRAGEVRRMPGFDGEYGTVKLFEPGEIDDLDGQMNLFSGFGLKMAESPETENGQQDMNTPSNGNAFPDGDSPSDGNPALVQGGRPAASDKEGGKEALQEERKTAAKAKEKAGMALNSEQEEAVRDVSRALMVVAGPGTGKTRTLIARILWLLQNRKVKPAEITAVTFTNKAAKEMRDRLAHEIGVRNARKVHIGTFHSICFQMQKEKEDIVLLDELEAMEIGEEILKKFQIKGGARQFLRQVSRWKNEGRPENEELSEAFSCYDQSLKMRGLLDFDDLLLEGLNLEDGQEKRFSYLLVDEFQDISPLQYELIRKWNKNGRELFVIGDPDQAIYGFRGADAACFQRLETDHPGIKTMRLKENYRSYEPILNCAKQVIEKNPGGSRALTGARGDGPLVREVFTKGSMAEAIFIAKEINRLVGGIDMLDTETQDSGKNQACGERTARSFSDIAVLYRTHRQAALLEKCLKKEGIPYVVAGREDFLEEKNVRGTICFFRGLLEEKDGFARKTAEKLLWGAEEQDGAAAAYEATAEKYAKEIRKEKPQKILEKWIQDMGLEEDEGLEKLVSTSLFYKNMEEFLDQLAFGSESDIRRCGGKVYRADSVTLMTLHGAKGLEFPAVLIYGAEKGTIPLETAKGETDEEEERRLFYVGLTRAMEELLIVSGPEPSPFLNDLPGESCSQEHVEKKKEERPVQLSLFDLYR